MDPTAFETLCRAAGQTLVEGDRGLDVGHADAQRSTHNLHAAEPSWDRRRRAGPLELPGVRSGYSRGMNRSQPLDHLEHLDKELVEELAQVARVTVREELREQTRKQRRTATLYAASGATALYAGGAVALAIGLALAGG
ncbi:hypothetical protein ACNFR4_06200, partial [Streptomyces sp. CPS1]